MIFPTLDASMSMSFIHQLYTCLFPTYTSSLNDVSCVCVTETWFKDFMSDESVGMSGYCCERKDRLGRADGGCGMLRRTDSGI